MTSQEREILSGALEEVCSDMLSAGGRSPQPVTTPAPEGNGAAAHTDRTLVASVGLSGQDVKGALVVMGCPEFFQSIYPSELSPSAVEDDLADWAGEVANQMVGRLKNRFCQRGLDFSISTPTVNRGVRLHVCRGDQQSVIHRSLSVEAMLVDVYLQIARKDDRPLFTEESTTGAASSEGETLLF